MPSMVVTLSMQLRQDAMTIIPWHTQPRLVNRLVIAEELDQPWPKKWWLIPRLPWWLTLIFCHQKWVNFYVKVNVYRPGQPNWEYTMWKFQDFLLDQIFLREINFGHFVPPKTAILIIWTVLHFWELLTFSRIKI